MPKEVKAEEKIKPGRAEVALGEIEGVAISVNPKVDYVYRTQLEVTARLKCPHKLAEAQVHFDIMTGRIENTWLDLPQVFWLQVERLLLEKLDLTAFKEEIYRLRLLQKTEEVTGAQKQLARLEGEKADAVKMLVDCRKGGGKLKVKES